MVVLLFLLYCHGSLIDHLFTLHFIISERLAVNGQAEAFLDLKLSKSLNFHSIS